MLDKHQSVCLRSLCLSITPHPKAHYPDSVRQPLGMCEREVCDNNQVGGPFYSPGAKWHGIHHVHIHKFLKQDGHLLATGLGKEYFQ